MSLTLAESISSWSNWILIGALIVGVVATYGIVVSGNVKEAALKLEVAKAGESAAHAIKQAAILEKEAAEARAETERIKNLVAWRAFSNSQVDTIIAVLAVRRGTVAIAYVQNDPESVHFAMAISSLFIDANKKAGESRWQYISDPRMYSDRNIFGLSIFGKDGNALADVRQAFTAAGVNFSPEFVATAVTKIGGMTTSSEVRETDVVIMVGSKPPPF